MSETVDFGVGFGFLETIYTEDPVYNGEEQHNLVKVFRKDGNPFNTTKLDKAEFITNQNQLMKLYWINPSNPNDDSDITHTFLVMDHHGMTPNYNCFYNWVDHGEEFDEYDGLIDSVFNYCTKDITDYKTPNELDDLGIEYHLDAKAHYEFMLGIVGIMNLGERGND